MKSGLRQVSDGRILYVDMNAFYASIEQQEHPQLRGLPVAVVSHKSPSGTVLASSYEAKALGILTGMKLREALSISPTLSTPETNAYLYKAYHLRLKKILDDEFGDGVQMRSIDEAVVRLPTNVCGNENARLAASSFKERLRNSLGTSIRCSIGITPNTLLAKVATDLQKPNGLVTIRAETIPDTLNILQLTDLPGIARRQAAHLIAAGIKTPLDFFRADPGWLKQSFGIWGLYWWWNLHGYEISATTVEAKSVSHEHVLEKWFNRREEGWPTCSKMADRVIYRLRRNGFSCRHLSLSISFKGLTRTTFERHFDQPIADYPTLIRAIAALYGQLPSFLPVPARKVSITLSELSQNNAIQLTLLGESSLFNEALSQALLSIRSRHGFESIGFATSQILKPAALKEQPGFGRIKDSVQY